MLMDLIGGITIEHLLNILLKRPLKVIDAFGVLTNVRISQLNVKRVLFFYKHKHFTFLYLAHESPNAAKTYKDQDKLENRAAFLPFSFPSAETFQSVNAFSKATSYTTNSSLSFTCSNQSSVPSPSIPIISSIDLHVTNLDQSIGAKEMKNLLTSVFKQHVVVCRQYATCISK